MRALLSVFDKTGLADLARGLVQRGYELVSTGRTAKAIREADLPVMDVADVTGFPEIMDGRVKTLHPKIHAGILARRNLAADMETIGKHGIKPFDLVAVNLYPFASGAHNPETPFDELVELIDIGGPSMVRAAAKNFRDVLVVVRPEFYPAVLAELDRPGGPSLDFRLSMMQSAFRHTATFDRVVAMHMSAAHIVDGKAVRGTIPTMQSLRYGENPHQEAGWLPHDPESELAWRVRQGKELSYTNLLDLEAALKGAIIFGTDVAALVVKHTNPCGAATGWTQAEAYALARDTDPVSAFGGIVGLTRKIDTATARELVSTFIECVIAPDVDEDALAILATKPNMRVVTVDYHATRLWLESEDALEQRSFLGGWLSQTPDLVDETQNYWPNDDLPRVVTKRHPSPQEWVALRMAWRLTALGKSNTIAYASADRLLALGAGQTSRIDSAKIAFNKAPAGSLRGSVVGSDAFIPFRDTVEFVAAVGATAIVQTGGSKNDNEVIAAADAHGMAMVFTGRRHFRH